MTKTKKDLLFYAVESGRIEDVEFFLSEGVDVRATIFFTTVLFHSVYNLHYQITNAILQYDSFVINNSTNYQEDKPLHLAVRKRDINMIRLLISYNADPNAMNSGGTSPLFEAVYEEQEEIVRLLLEAGGDFNIPSRLSPLQFSTMRGSLKLIQLFIEYNADESAIREIYQQKYPNKLVELDQAVFVAHNTIVSNMIVISRSLEYSSQLANLPYLSDCFVIIADYVGGYGKRLNSTIVDTLHHLVENQVVQVSLNNQSAKRKQQSSHVRTDIKRRRTPEEEDEDEATSYSINDVEEVRALHNAYSPAAGECATSASSLSPIDQHTTTVAYTHKQYGFNHECHQKISQQDAPKDENLLVTLFPWISDLSNALRQQTLYFMQQVSNILNTPTVVLANQHAEEVFLNEYQEHYGQKYYLSDDSLESAQISQKDTPIFFSDSAEIISKDGIFSSVLKLDDMNFLDPILHFGTL